MKDKTPYQISMAVNYLMPVSETKMEIVYITYGLFEDAVEADNYCRETIVFLFPVSPEKDVDGISYFNHRHSFSRTDEETYEHMSAIAEKDGALFFEYSLE